MKKRGAAMQRCAHSIPKNARVAEWAAFEPVVLNLARRWAAHGRRGCFVRLARHARPRRAL